MTLGENSKIAIGVIITAVIMIVVNWVIATGEAGLDAQSEKQIEAVVEKALTRDGEKITVTIGNLQTEMAGIRGDLQGVRGELGGINRVLDIVVPAASTH